MSKLSAKQDAFCREFLVDWNGSAACRRAGYSEHTANRTSSRLLTKAHIQERIAELKAEVDAKTSWNAEWVRERMMAVANEAEATGQLAVASGMLNTMSKCEGMQSDKLELTGRQQIQFNIRTGKK